MLRRRVVRAMSLPVTALWCVMGLACAASAPSRAASSPRDAAGPPPEWAYPPLPSTFRPRAEDGIPRHVPGSSVTYSITQLRNMYVGPVWHPEDSPPPPALVVSGRKPGVYACGFCHRGDGPGGVENVNLRGLPEAYFVQQIAEFRSGARNSAAPAREPFKFMAEVARNLGDEEVRELARYFAALPPRRTVRVVEAVTIPKPWLAGWFYAAARDDAKEALGERIIEVPVDLEQFENRDTRAQFIAYVPLGSVARGERLARDGGGRTVACAGCHGAGLRGLGDVPGIAGRSPSYLMRQLYELRTGLRSGPAVALMQPTVARLRQRDMLDLAAYLASLPP